MLKNLGAVKTFIKMVNTCRETGMEGHDQYLNIKKVYSAAFILNLLQFIKT